MTLRTVSLQGFTVHNHMCGINFLSHFKGAPHKLTPNWDRLGCSGMNREGGGAIAEIAGIARDRKSKTRGRVKFHMDTAGGAPALHDS
jgi:hypothetical protein